MLRFYLLRRKTASLQNYSQPIRKAALQLGASEAKCVGYSVCFRQHGSPRREAWLLLPILRLPPLLRVTSSLTSKARVAGSADHCPTLLLLLFLVRTAQKNSFPIPGSPLAEQPSFPDETLPGY